MSVQTRAEILEEISNLEGSKTLAYITGDRPGLGTQISSDHLPLFPRHIDALGKPKKITLFLYTRGGDTNATWPLISFLRENCDYLQVIFPFYNHSSGTLLALGADEIVMGPYASLSPIDPTVFNQFNPNSSDGTQNKIPIAVEDMLSYFELVKDEVKGRKNQARAFEELISNVHPLALGNVRRNINLIRTLARKLIQLHSSEFTDRKITQMVTALTTEFYTHNHLIGRAEARELGLNVLDASPEQLKLMNRYYDELVIDLKLLEPWNVINISSSHSLPEIFENLRALIETSTTSDALISRIRLDKTNVATPQGNQQVVNANLEFEGWVSS